MGAKKEQKLDDLGCICVDLQPGGRSGVEVVNDEAIEAWIQIGLSVRGVTSV